MLVTNDNLMRTVQVGVTMLNFPEGFDLRPGHGGEHDCSAANAGGVRHVPAQVVGGIMGGR